MALREQKTNGNTPLPEVEDTTREILETAAPIEALPDHEPGQEQDAETVAAIFRRVALEQDMARVKVGAALMNVFNYAVQVQAGRNDWNHDDFRAFIVAHSAIDQIGKNHINKQKEERDKEHLRAVEAEVTEQQHPTARRTNLPTNKME